MNGFLGICRDTGMPDKAMRGTLFQRIHRPEPVLLRVAQPDPSRAVLAAPNRCYVELLANGVNYGCGRIVVYLLVQRWLAPIMDASAKADIERELDSARSVWRFGRGRRRSCRSCTSVTPVGLLSPGRGSGAPPLDARACFRVRLRIRQATVTVARELAVLAACMIDTLRYNLQWECRPPEGRT